MALPTEAGLHFASLSTASLSTASLSTSHRCPLRIVDEMGRKTWAEFLPILQESVDSGESLEDVARKREAIDKLDNALKEAYTLRNRRRRENAISSTESRSIAKIECPAFLSDRFRQWREDPSTFLADTDVTANLAGRLDVLYLTLRDQSERNGLAGSRWRFLLLLFHNWKTEFGIRLSRHASADFARFILQLGLVNDDPETVISNVAKWGNAGGRYDQLKTSLNRRAKKDEDKRGVVLIFPDDITPYQYEQAIPLSGEKHDRFIGRLFDRDICGQASLSGADDAADSIWKYFQKQKPSEIWEDVLENVDPSTGLTNSNATLVPTSIPGNMGQIMTDGRFQSRGMDVLAQAVFQAQDTNALPVTAQEASSVQQSISSSLPAGFADTQTGEDVSQITRFNYANTNIDWFATFQNTEVQLAPYLRDEPVQFSS